MHPELCSDFKPYSPSPRRWRGAGSYSADDGNDRQNRKREPRWTEIIAVGSEEFVEKRKAQLGIRPIGREVSGEDGVYELRESEISYKANFAGENSGLRPKNTYFWESSD